MRKLQEKMEKRKEEMKKGVIDPVEAGKSRKWMKEHRRRLLEQVRELEVLEEGRRRRRKGRQNQRRRPSDS